MNDSSKKKAYEYASERVKKGESGNFSAEFFHYINALAKNEESTLKNVFKFENIDANGKTATFHGTEKSITLRFLDKEKQRIRRNLRDELLTTTLESSKELFGKYDLIAKLNLNINNLDRSNHAIFGEHLPIDNDEFKSENLVPKLRDKNISIKEKEALFTRFILDANDKFMKICDYKSDEEFVRNYAKIDNSKNFFGVQNIDEVFECVTGSHLSKETKDLWNKLTCQHQTSIEKIMLDYCRISNPTYQYFSDHDMEKLSDVVDTPYLDSIFDRPSTHPEYAGKNIDPEFRSQCELLVDFNEENLKLKKNMIPTSNLFNVVAISKKLDENSCTLFDSQGKKITLDEANEVTNKGKTVGVVKNNGERFTVRCGRNCQPHIKNLPDKPVDYKDTYKDMLNTLNSGTTRFNISSKEYRNMRNILSDLSKGKGNEPLLLRQLKANIDKYNENYEKKSSISELAAKRKDCVDKVASEFYDILTEKVFDPILEKPELTKENEKSGKKQIVLDELDSKNSQIHKNEPVNSKQKTKEYILDFDDVTYKDGPNK